MVAPLRFKVLVTFTIHYTKNRVFAYSKFLSKLGVRLEHDAH